MEFELEFNNPEKLNDVYVVSDRNNVKKYIQASWNQTTQKYEANGYFDETNHSYVPGIITVEYSRSRPQILPGDSTDIENDILLKTMPSGLEQSKVVESTDAEGNYKLNVSFAGAVQELIDEEVELVIKTYDKEFGGDFASVMGSYSNFFSYFVEGADDEKYVLNLDFTDEKTWVMVINDISGDKAIEYLISAAEVSENAAKISDIIGTLSTINTVTKPLLDMLEAQDDMEDLRDTIMYSNMTSEQKIEALAKADELEKDRGMFIAISLIITAATTTITTGGMAAPALAFSLLFGAITASSSFFWDMRMAGILSGGSGVNASWRWKVDPSGYVYEAVESNRLQGVTTTAYWYEPEKGETEANSKLWDAGEWDQCNPITTDINGCYAWDVPEGMWRVKYELDG